MKPSKKEIASENLKANRIRNRNAGIGLFRLLIITFLILLSNAAFAHCDTMDGPLIRDARFAIKQNNVNIVLKWVRQEDEAEIKNAFSLTMKVMDLSPYARELAEKYFFETLVRIHRSGEGVPFTGVKPSGTPIDEKILAADRSIEVGNLTPLKDMVPKDKLPELTERFAKVMSLKNFDVNYVESGREYIEAYVQFFKFAEGEEEGQIEAANHTTYIPWILSGFFFITTIIFGGLFLRKNK
jgi:hypothetical protein